VRDAVLVLRRGGLGDTLLMLPVLDALRRAHPGAGLHFAGVLEFAAVLAEFGAVDRALSSESLQLWALRSDTADGERARARLGAYTHVVADDPAAAAAGTCVQVFDPRPLLGDVPLALQIGKALGLRIDLGLAVLPRRPPAVGRGPVALAPGSGSPAKCWPRARWLELAAHLAAAAPLAVVVGPVEIERDDPRRWPWPAGTSFVAEPGCVELAHRLAAARAFVGNDSGVTHLAAAMLVPTVALFGPTAPAVWGPPSPSCTCVDTGTGAAPPDVAVTAVLAAVLATWVTPLGAAPS
jgi:ADP-heptose:LPS heptosyltransferase